MPRPTPQLSDAERTLLATLGELPRAHPIVSMFAFDLPPTQTTLLLSRLRGKRSGAATQHSAWRPFGAHV